jgi:hypothetical protein
VAAVASASRETSIIAVPEKAEPFSSRHPADSCHNQPQLSSTDGPPTLYSHRHHEPASASFRNASQQHHGT